MFLTDFCFYAFENDYALNNEFVTNVLFAITSWLLNIDKMTRAYSAIIYHFMFTDKLTDVNANVKIDKNNLFLQ